MTITVLAGFQTLLILNLGENSRILQYFEWLPWNSGQTSENFGEIMDFQSCLPSIFYRISNVVLWGGYVDIFWSSPFQFEGSDVISVLKNSIEYSFVFFKCL